MIPSRIRRHQDEVDRKRIMMAIGGSIALLVFLLLFGVKILVGFSLLVDKMRGASPATTNPANVLIFPPTLDSWPNATNSAKLALTGTGEKDLSVIIYVNDSKFDTIDVEDDGTFEIDDLPLKEGENAISAKHENDKGKTSDLSNVITIVYDRKKPELIVEKPENESTVEGESNMVEVAGTTEEDASVTVNDRFVVIRSDYTFTYSYPLNEGENILTIVATDPAGNTAKTERRVTYKK